MIAEWAMTPAGEAVHRYRTAGMTYCGRVVDRRFDDQPDGPVCQRCDASAPPLGRRVECLVCGDEDLPLTVAGAVPDHGALLVRNGSPRGKAATALVYRSSVRCPGSGEMYQEAAA